MAAACWATSVKWQVMWEVEREEGKVRCVGLAALRCLAGCGPPRLANGAAVSRKRPATHDNTFFYFPFVTTVHNTFIALVSVLLPPSDYSLLVKSRTKMDYANERREQTSTKLCSQDRSQYGFLCKQW